MRPTESIVNTRPIKTLLLSVALFITGFCSGQQWPQYALSSFSLVEINPAAAGLDGMLAFSGATRRQWNNLPGSPTGYHLSAQAPLPFISSGVGFSLLQDQIGLQQQIEFTGVYSYHYNIGRKTVLSAGVAAGFLQSVFDGEGIRTPGGAYTPGGGGNHNDDLLPSGTVGGVAPIVHGGAALQGATYTMGASVRYAQGGTLRLKGEDENAGIRLRPHLLAHAQYRTTGTQLIFIPVANFRTDGVAWQGEGQFYAQWRERFIIGAGIRGWQESNLDAWIATAGVRISERFLLLYAFEGGISSLRRAHNGTFELTLRYEIDIFGGRAILPPRIYNPRFL